MRFTDEHEMFRATVREVVQKEIDPHADAWEAAGTFPAHELFPKLGELGLLGVEYDPAYGGGGADHVYTMILGEELGRSASLGVSMAIAVQTDMATPALHQFGSHELKERYLRPAIAGEMVAAIGVSEPDAGSDVAGIRTRAVRDGDEWVISGSKTWITSGTQADWICLLCRTSDEGGYRGMSQIIVPTDSEGFSVSRKLDKLGMRASDTAELVLDEVRVPVENTIGEIGRGFQQQMAQFQNERMIAAYQMIGAVEQALERTVAYLRERYAFGAPLLANQSLQYELADIASELDVMRHHNWAAVEAYRNGEDITRHATVAKLRSARLARRMADTAVQYHGGMGYVEENWTARFYRDTRLWSIGGGADEVMLRTLARMNGITAD
ncbi:MAG TPA: acyl-CoA dehydrogenase family protein [Microthrixaceae bacterium]|nr:acyl-CoA dehydrogenase family protein [Microthrixaceae bacterium]